MERKTYIKPITSLLKPADNIELQIGRSDDFIYLGDNGLLKNNHLVLIDNSLTIKNEDYGNDNS